MDKSKFKQKLETQLLVKNKIIKSLGEKPLNSKKIEREYRDLYLSISKTLTRHLKGLRELIV